VPLLLVWRIPSKLRNSVGLALQREELRYTYTPDELCRCWGSWSSLRTTDACRTRGSVTFQASNRVHAPSPPSASPDADKLARTLPNHSFAVKFNLVVVIHDVRYACITMLRRRHALTHCTRRSSRKSLNNACTSGAHAPGARACRACLHPFGFHHFRFSLAEGRLAKRSAERLLKLISEDS
jgi:hypothetical protein